MKEERNIWRTLRRTVEAAWQDVLMVYCSPICRMMVVAFVVLPFVLLVLWLMALL
jgi:hypothetical protein